MKISAIKVPTNLCHELAVSTITYDCHSGNFEVKNLSGLMIVSPR